MGFACASPTPAGSMQGFENVVVHEIGGHAIGHLADCYTRNSTISAAKIQATLDWQNSDGIKTFLSLITKLPALGTSSSMPQSMICTTPASACSKALDLTIKVSGVPNRSVV